MNKYEQHSEKSIHLTLVTLLFFLFISHSSFTQHKSHPFKKGEKLTYSMHFGWFEVGKAEISIDPELEYVDGKAHYSVQCSIYTAPWVKFFRNFNACYESLVNAQTLKPLVSYRDLKSGREIDIRTDKFYYGDSVKVHAYVEDLDENRYHTFGKKDVPILDFLSTYLHVRNVNFEKSDEPVEVRTFYSNTLYEFQMFPQAHQTYNLKSRKVKARELKLEFPENEMFKKGKHGSLIISEDKEKLPLRVDINIILGSFILKLQEDK
ncbi:MAG: DUF3108 domain-containing protein [Cyclobacteriaceae bacterium]